MDLSLVRLFFFLCIFQLSCVIPAVCLLSHLQVCPVWPCHFSLFSSYYTEFLLFSCSGFSSVLVRHLSESLLSLRLVSSDGLNASLSELVSVYECRIAFEIKTVLLNTSDLFFLNLTTYAGLTEE